MCERDQNTTLFTYKTEYCADSVEWCPHEPLQNLFVCANYQLNETKTEEPSNRVGRILLFSYDPSEGLELHQTLDTPAVLDQKWCHSLINGYSVLGVVNSQRTLEIYKLKSKIELELVTSFTFNNETSERLLLSLDWSTGKYKSEEPEIVCSDSQGSFHRFALRNGELVLENSFCGHEFEAWIAAFYYWDTNVAFSGADDSVLLKYDKRCGIEPIAKNKSHEAGVTSLHSNSSKEHILVSGSYDENVRLWDLRTFKRPLDSLKVPGPLWRVKWDPFEQKKILTACMLGGAHIIEDLNTTSSYYEHKNIVYGADWSFLKSDHAIIATCSFYDRLLCISEVKF